MTATDAAHFAQFMEPRTDQRWTNQLSRGWKKLFMEMLKMKAMMIIWQIDWSLQDYFVIFIKFKLI